ncbi:transcriptional regulator, TetR family [Actinacidiphila yanglinensis]|uniref:Transcriptional regulator, TetR family n=1 Tax=Actinacidiphila yanglinensis TaxID=310779 RepID=A0A1H6DBG0_9ACTN|nr:TetR/AcrR family transcriptional regulator [Actinacidiphila yanglinensis]SEG82579.1 transcriptional regulator, TetR family [Actinacidiphila yanglinensis]
MARTREFDTDAAVEAAMAVFRLKGFEGASIQDLVDATEVGRGSLYGAFGSKEGLYLAALDRYRERYATPLSEMLTADMPARRLVREVLTGVVDEIVRDGSRQACLIVAGSMERAHREDEVRDRLRGTIESLEESFTQLVARAQAAGELADDRSAVDTARFLVMCLQGLRVIGAVRPDRALLMATVDTALRCLN